MTMATLRATDEQSTHRPRLYDFAEGFGSVYGRYVRNHLCQRLISQYSIHSVLEAPCNSESYFASPGTQSFVFAQRGCRVSLLHPEHDVIQKTRDFWSALGMPDTPAFHHTDLYHLPFDSDHFDLVWNFDYIPLFDDPARFIGEMARVSKDLVMVIVPNCKNIGYPLHALLNVVQRRQSQFGSRAWMGIKPVAQAMRSSGVKVIESGLVDIPPWPGFDALSPIGKVVRRNTVEARDDERTDEEVEQMLKKLTFIEYAPVPQLFKIPFSHQLFVIGQKTKPARTG
ncbi:MAG: class I SAM-dependent methyltransferase [Candidatus Binatia bacterium]